MQNLVLAPDLPVCVAEGEVSERVEGVHGEICGRGLVVSAHTINICKLQNVSYKNKYVLNKIKKHYDVYNKTSFHLRLHQSNQTKTMLFEGGCIEPRLKC